MLNLYYRVWADAITFEKTKHGHLRNWKTYTLFPISIIMGVNLLTISLLLGGIFDIWILKFIRINIFPIQSLNKALSGIITLFLPFLLLNYLLIFKKKQYEWIVKRFPYSKGRIYLIYVLVSLGVIILPLIIGKLFFG